MSVITGFLIAHNVKSVIVGFLLTHNIMSVIILCYDYIMSVIMSVIILYYIILDYLSNCRFSDST